MSHVDLAPKQLRHIKGRSINIHFPKSQDIGNLLPRLGFIICSHPGDTMGRHCGILLGPAGFLIQIETTVYSSPQMMPVSDFA